MNISTSEFPYYKVYFKHGNCPSNTLTEVETFPYYKVYFKPRTVLLTIIIELNFHTIKSILNSMTALSLLTSILYFHTIKSILNSFVCLIGNCRSEFPYYKVYFKQI